MAEADTAPSPETTEAPVPKPPGKLALFLQKKGTAAKEWFCSRQPRPFTTAVMLVGTVILLGLGNWQLQRTEEKNQILDRIQNEFAQPARNLQQSPPNQAQAWQDLHYKPVVLQGVWQKPYYALRLGPRVYEQTVGYHLMMPLRLSDGQVVLVNRGFMPEKMASLPPVEGQEVVVQGVAYEPDGVKPQYVPENVPSRDIWTWVDLIAMAHEVGVKPLVPVLVYEDRVSDRDSYPIGGQLPLPSHNRHWHYAVTWFALALALMVIWMIASNPKAAQAAAAQPQDSQKETTDPVALRGMYPEATD